ncbi:endonuclease [Flavobacterium sp.]|uniref:endonuclease n=1 Tax=Flavobacterium sp. TaxID=239 RepID=UPI0037507795
MKSKLQLLILLSSFLSFSQIPTGYYSTATGTGYALKTQLYNKIKGHTNNGYAGLWTTYATSDRDNQYENDNTVFDLYSENPNGIDPVIFAYGTNQCGTYTTQGNCYNREHIIPQSVFNSASPMVADAHFIPPVDGYVNGMRSDNPHGTVAVAAWTSLNGSKVGTSSVVGYTGKVFEPLNDFKGDIARMYFYFATRYENTVSTYIFDMFNGTSNQVFTTPFLNMLITWHNQDPVSAREIARNNAIYARQLNRNPFIDHPEYVSMIWGGTPPTLDTTIPTTPANLVASNITTTSLQLNWTASTDNIGVTSYDVFMNGIFKTNVASTTASITNLTSGTNYSFYVNAKDAASNVSANSTTINTATLAVSLVTDLYFSKYIEGSSNNKVLEIANGTGTSVTLSSYIVKKQTNGAGAWSTGITLSGTLANGAKYVMLNSSTSLTCYSVASANYSSAGNELTFNGNDAVGLFKNGVLIDIIGTFNGGTANFAIDETLRRNTTVAVPKATFNKTTDWTVYSLDTCSGIGNKFVATEEPISVFDFKLYPNPSNGDFTIQLSNENSIYNVEIFSTLGQKVFEKQNNIETLVINNLQIGIYLVNITVGDKSLKKKIIIN